MSSPAFGIQTGSVVGTTAKIEIRTLGFERPIAVQLGNSDGDELFWSATEGDGYGMKRTAAGVGTEATTGGITPQDNGFDIGTDAAINQSGKVIHWAAFGI